MLEAGGYLRGVSDATLMMNLYEASLMATEHTFRRIVNPSYFNWARRKLVTCLAARTSIINVVNNMVKEKTLADLSVKYDLNHTDKINDLQRCIDEMLPIVESGGLLGPGTSLPVQSITPGSNHPDRPDFGRGYSVGSRGGANTKATIGDGTRVKNTFGSGSSGTKGTNRTSLRPYTWGGKNKG